MYQKEIPLGPKLLTRCYLKNEPCLHSIYSEVFFPKHPPFPTETFIPTERSKHRNIFKFTHHITTDSIRRPPKYTRTKLNSIENIYFGQN